MPFWTWDPKKNRVNKSKHGLSFETAQLVFDDPLALSRPDTSSDDERWQTIGDLGGLIVFVVHSSHEGGGRLISARKATAHERRAYEEGEF